MLRLSRRTGPSGIENRQLRSSGIALPARIGAEWCYYISTLEEQDESEMARLQWLLGETFDPEGLRYTSYLRRYQTVLEVGPRLNFETPWGSTARQICQQIGLTKVVRIERSRRFGFERVFDAPELELLATTVYDRMTETVYAEPLESFDTGLVAASVRAIPVLAGGMDTLRAINTELGLAMSESDLVSYFKLFADVLCRDPTDVELFQLGQANSEHSRHPFFRGQLVLDGTGLGYSLMDVVRRPWRANPNNSVIAFHDDSSAIDGGAPIPALVPAYPGTPTRMEIVPVINHRTLTAETHNHPTRIAPFPGASTGGGGRIRDNQCVGRGGHVVVSGVGFCVGNLGIPSLLLPWEQDGHAPPIDGATPLDILIEGSNGSSAYGNCFGEPTVIGFARSLGMQTPSGYRAFDKPVMYSVGMGAIDSRHTEKQPPQAGMIIVQIGGPAYRIGLGGGAASSMMAGANSTELDLNSVQRGDPEMGQRVNRVIRACIELGEENPIQSAHDLGAGGDSNALPEVMDPAGGIINLRALPVGDATLSALEIWGNESQERNVLLIWPYDFARFKDICDRENVPCAEVGEVTGNGQLVVFDARDGSTPVNLPLEPILGDYLLAPVELHSLPITLEPLVLPENLTLLGALMRLLQSLAVGSKRWATTKADRSVTGLIAQQQCVGPLHTPLSNYAVTAQGYFGITGTAYSLGERPLLGLISPAAQGRMTVGEALTNMMGAVIIGIPDIRCSSNWMWPAKLPGEGARLLEAAQAITEVALAMGMAIDGGKDSLSMATKEGSAIIKAPGQNVLAFYAPMEDVRKKVTPDLKQAGNYLVFVDLAHGKARLGGSTLGQVFSSLGDECPDLEDSGQLLRAFDLIQTMVSDSSVVSLHDKSDGGLAVTLVEMAIAGNLGATFDMKGNGEPIAMFFNEELGVVLEVIPEELHAVLRKFRNANITHQLVGRVQAAEDRVTILYNSETVFSLTLPRLRMAWEAVAHHIELQQANPACVEAEFQQLTRELVEPNWHLSYQSEPYIATEHPKVAVIRAEGSNGDREMMAALHVAGFEVHDITISDLLSGRASLDAFRGIVFPGGFSYGDVLDSAKGWAGVIRFNDRLRQQFEAFYARDDTFSLGVCNGAQLSTLLGWAPFNELADDKKPRFIHNTSERFESRFPTVAIYPSPAMMLRGMDGSALGVWVAHGEGRLHVPDPDIMRQILELGLAPIRYVSSDGLATENYPANPNGSPHGIAALCSPDGRHLAMMPHPERLSNAMWQWPWRPAEWVDLETSPWQKMFQNAHHWCVEH